MFIELAYYCIINFNLSVIHVVYWSAVKGLSHRRIKVIRPLSRKIAFKRYLKTSKTITIFVKHASSSSQSNIIFNLVVLLLSKLIRLNQI